MIKECNDSVVVADSLNSKTKQAFAVNRKYFLNKKFI